MARKYQHTKELLPQIKEMLAKGMTQREIENALGLTGSRPIHHLVAIGIGGSYLGARAGLEFVKGTFGNQLHEGPGLEVYFAGNNLSSSYI